MAKRAKPPGIIGWREWVGLPGLGVVAIKAKIDTGARTSALHAWNVAPFTRNDAPWVRFDLHPVQRDNNTVQSCTAPLTGRRRVRSSSGHAENRFVIRTTLSLGDDVWPVDITLTARDEMGFRMLLGRAALRRRFLIDPARSFLIGRQPDKDRT